MTTKPKDGGARLAEIKERVEKARKTIQPEAFWADFAFLLDEVHRLDHLHKLDHSLADQWQAKVEALEKERAASSLDAMEEAWGLIANAWRGNWDEAPQDWQDAAARWRDTRWHVAIRALLPAPQVDTKPSTLNHAAPQVEKREVRVLEFEARMLNPATGRMDVIHSSATPAPGSKPEGECQHDVPLGCICTQCDPGYFATSP